MSNVPRFPALNRRELVRAGALSLFGLGLPSVRQITQLHGGRARAEGVVGQGATFHVALPLGGSAREDDALSTSASATPTPSS